MSKPINPNITYPSNEPKFDVTKDDIIRGALREFSRDELENMPRPMVTTIYSLLKKAMQERGKDLTQDELEEIREIVTEHLYPAALEESLKNSKP